MCGLQFKRMQQDGDVPLLDEPWMFLVLVLFGLTCAVFLLSVTVATLSILTSSSASDDAN